MEHLKRSLCGPWLQVFFCKYNDPLYVKMEKLEIMILLANEKNIDQVRAAHAMMEGRAGVCVQACACAVTQCCCGTRSRSFVSTGTPATLCAPAAHTPLHACDCVRDHV